MVIPAFSADRRCPLDPGVVVRRVDVQAGRVTPSSRADEAVASDLNALVQDCVRTTLTVSQREPSVTAPYKLQMNLAPVPSMKINVAELRGALSNLLKNAEKSVPLGGTIAVATGSDAELAYVSVGEAGAPGRVTVIRLPVHNRSSAEKIETTTP